MPSRLDAHTGPVCRHTVEGADSSMGRRALVLLRHGTPLEEAVDPARHLSDAGKAQAAFAANGLCAYLELPSTFMPMAYGEPCPVAIYHSGKERAAQTATIVNDGLSAAKCETTLTECVAAASITSAIPIATSAESHCHCTVPHSRNVAALKPDAAPDAALALVAASSTPLTVLVGHLPLLHQIATNLGIVIGADAFAPCGGVVLEANGNGGWMLAHHIVPEQEKKDWWRHGVSVHIRADETGCEDFEPVTETDGHKCPCTD